MMLGFLYDRNSCLTSDDQYLDTHISLITSLTFLGCLLCLVLFYGVDELVCVWGGVDVCICARARTVVFQQKNVYVFVRLQYVLLCY